MCLQCLVESSLLVDQALPGYSVYVSTRDHKDWPLGWFGLVRLLASHYPVFVWKHRPTLDPYFGTNADYEEDHDTTEFDAADDEVNAIRLYPEQGYFLVRAAVEVGYDPAVHGTFSCWFIHRLATKMLCGS